MEFSVDDLGGRVVVRDILGEGIVFFKVRGCGYVGVRRLCRTDAVEGVGVGFRGSRFLVVVTDYFVLEVVSFLVFF